MLGNGYRAHVVGRVRSQPYASFAARAFNHFMDCVYMSQKTKKENPTTAQKDSKPQNATMQPRNDERSTDTSIAMHRERSDVDKPQEIGLHNTFVAMSVTLPS